MKFKLLPKPLLLIATVVAGMSLIACGSINTRPFQVEKTQASSYFPKYWKLNARIKIDLADERVAMRVIWEQLPEMTRLRAYGPLRSSLFKLLYDDQGVQLLLSNGEKYSAETLSALLPPRYRAYPVELLSYWFRGIPAPALEFESLTVSDDGLISGFQQAGWRVEATDYLLASGVWLPTKVNILGNQTRLVVRNSRWNSIVPGK